MSGSMKKEEYILFLSFLLCTFYSCLPTPLFFIQSHSKTFCKVPQRTLWPQPTKFFPKKIPYIFFLKKLLLKKFLLFSQKSPPNFQETELPYIFLKKAFLTFWERYIQNPSTLESFLNFRKGIFRTLS